MSVWAADNRTDRAVGEAWEARFEDMAEGFGFECHKPEAPETWWPDKGLLPDRLVQRDKRHEWHELKHKRPSRRHLFGLEAYRLDALLRLAKHVGDAVLYTIHNWEAAGARSAGETVPNRIEDWVTIDVLELPDTISESVEKESTYYAGSKAKALIHYWDADAWDALSLRWEIEVRSRPVQQKKLWALGTPLTPPRLCPSCHDSHPVGTTCAKGWAPWDPFA